MQTWASHFASLSLFLVSYLLKGLGDDNNTTVMLGLKALAFPFNSGPHERIGPSKAF